MSETNIFDDLFQMFINDINDVMVRVLASNTIDPRLESHDRVRVRVRVRAMIGLGLGLGLEPWSGQTKDYKMCICCFSAKHAALKSMSKDCMTGNQKNVSEWSNMSTCRLLF